MRARLTLILSTMCYLGLVTGLNAETIRNDRGGQIVAYLDRFAQLSLAEKRIVVEGQCLSACTLMLGMIPRDRICARPGAQFGFHSAWQPDTEGNSIESRIGNRMLMETYPTDVRQMIKKRGGLRKSMFYVPASKFVTDCADESSTKAHASAKDSRKRKARRAYARGR